MSPLQLGARALLDGEVQRKNELFARQWTIPRHLAAPQPSVPPPNALASAPTPARWPSSPQHTTAHR